MNEGGAVEFFYRVIDMYCFSFPSDNLTFGMLRNLLPDLFDKHYEGRCQLEPAFFRSHSPDSELETRVERMMFLERAIAAFAVGKAVGAPAWPSIKSQGQLERVKDDLAKLYTKLGLAEGKHAAGQLIRGIEEQARKSVPVLPPP